jgi:RNA polymerase sigma-70 factor (ECF subfamily)
MTPAPILFATTAADEFCIGHSYYGDIGISPESFVDYVWTVACKCIKQTADETAAIELLGKLYLRDLYVACGCVNNSEAAWKAFDARYRRFLIDLARLFYRRGSDSEEIADSILVSLCFPDRTGQQRIASYHGRSSLATWLRVIVINRSINDRTDQTMPANDNVANVPDCRALANLDSALRAERYGKIVSQSLANALRQTTPKERLMLRLRYDQNLQLGEIGRRMGIHQSNVTRQLIHLHGRLRDAVIKTLQSRHHLSSSAISECFADIIDNPQISIPMMSLIQDVDGIPEPDQHLIQKAG